MQGHRAGLRGGFRSAWSELPKRPQSPLYAAQRATINAVPSLSTLESPKANTAARSSLFLRELERAPKPANCIKATACVVRTAPGLVGGFHGQVKGHHAPCVLKCPRNKSRRRCAPPVLAQAPRSGAARAAAPASREETGRGPVRSCPRKRGPFVAGVCRRSKPAAPACARVRS